MPARWSRKRSCCGPSGRTLYVEESNLAQNISVLRKALGAVPDRHRLALKRSPNADTAFPEGAPGAGGADPGPGGAGGHPHCP